MRVLLTGATGFVGSHVARVLLDAGCDVVALVRPRSDMKRLSGVAERLSIWPGTVSSLADHEVLAAMAPEICIHLAWYAEPGKYLWSVAENLRSLRDGLDLVEALAAAGCRRFVGAGTCAEYGMPDPGLPIPETTGIRPSTPYARAKAAFSLAGQDAAGTAGMEWAWVRLFFLYGPWEHPDRVIPSALVACLRGEPFPATAGEQQRDYLHVEDAARAIWAVAGSDLSGPVNVSSGRTVTLRSVLEVVEAAAGGRGLVRFGERRYQPAEWMWMCGDNALLGGTGWRPRFTLGTGIGDTAAWWRRRLGAAGSEA
jgi:nucleoside-diphosphate-sugar epimerase